MRGPPPKPAERQLALGNPGHQNRARLPQTTAPIVDRVRIPRPPRELGKVGASVWRRLWRFAHIWLNKQTDLEIVTRYCENIELRAELRAAAAGRIITTGSTGQDIINPALRQLNQTERLLVTLETHLGLTPADRTRIGVGEVRAMSSLEALNEKRERRQREREAERERIENNGASRTSEP